MRRGPNSGVRLLDALVFIPNHVQIPQISGRAIQGEEDNNPSLLLFKGTRDHHSAPAEGGQHNRSRPSYIGHSRCCLHAGLVAQAPNDRMDQSSRLIGWVLNRSEDREILWTSVREFPDDDCLWGRIGIGSESIAMLCIILLQNSVNPKTTAIRSTLSI